LFIKDAGARAVSFDLGLLERRDLDPVAEVAEAGLGLLAGAVPTVTDGQARPRPPRDTAEAVVTLWRRMTLDPAALAGQVVVTPACGLAGLSPEQARARLEHCREAARMVPVMIPGGAAV